MRARAFTVMELLVVVALLIALAGIVVPRVIDRAARFELGESAQHVAAALETARARAIQNGTPMRVVAIESGGRVWIEAAEVGASEIVDAVGSGFDAGYDLSDEWPRDVVEGEGRTLELDELTPGVRVTSEPPELDAYGAGLGFGTAPLAEESFDPMLLGESAPVTLAIFLPDGSAVALPERYVVSTSPERNDAFVVRVLALTGQCVVERWAPPADEWAEPDEDDQAESDATRGTAEIGDTEMEPFDPDADGGGR